MLVLVLISHNHQRHIDASTSVDITQPPETYTSRCRIISVSTICGSELNICCVYYKHDLQHSLSRLHSIYTNQSHTVDSNIP